MKVLLVGLGRMGQRYVRVLNQLFDSGLAIYAVDPLAPKIEGVEVFPSLDSIKERNFDLGIDSHPNEGRLGVLQQFVNLGIKRVIVEKPIANSWNEASAVAALCKKYNLQFLSPFYNRFSEHFAASTFKKLDAGRLLTVSISGGALGMGCNGIHYIDLCSYLFNANPLSIFSSLDLDSVLSPRGAQYKDHGGLLVLDYPNGRATLELCSQSSAGVCIHFVFEHGRIVIHDQIHPQWFWFRRPDELNGQPLYRTSNELQVTPLFEYGIGVEVLMKLAISKFLALEATPGLSEALNALKALGLAASSSKLKRAVNWDEDQLLEGASFSFT
jgi:predicted dehydrogenase